MVSTQILIGVPFYPFRLAEIQLCVVAKIVFETGKVMITPQKHIVMFHPFSEAFTMGRV